MNYSVLSSLDKICRLRSQLRGRLNRIFYHQKNVPHFNAHRVDMHIEKLQKMVARLDNNHTIQSDTERASNYKALRSEFNRYGSTREHVKNLFGEFYEMEKRVEPQTDEEIFLHAYLKKLAESTRQARVSEIKYKIKNELIEAYQNDKFVVFNTLTVRESEIETTFCPKSKPWQAYLQKWERNTLGHRFFAVVERGEKYGRLHIHCLHIFDHAKNPLIDPNYGRNIPNLREINWFKSFWPHGFSSPIAVRFNQGDKWAQIGHRWPVDLRNDNQPIPAKPPEALAAYMAKYVIKNYLSERNLYQWRTRSNRGFGTRRLTLIMANLKTKNLRTVATFPQILKNHPKKLVIIEATRHWLHRMRNRKNSSLCPILSLVMPAPPISQRMTISTQMTDVRNSLKHTLIKTLSLNGAALSEIEFVTENVAWLYEPLQVQQKGSTWQNLSHAIITS